MAIINSDLMKSFSAGERVRTVSHRGSLLSDVAVFNRYNTNSAAQLAVGDIVPIMPIPYRSMIRNVSLGFAGAATTALVARLDLYGLKDDGKSIDTSVPIKQNVFTGVALGADAAAAMKAKDLSFDVAKQTLYNFLCEDKQIPNPDGTIRTIRVPSGAFAPYSENRFGVLAWTVTTAATAGDATSLGIIEVEYVESAPSAAPLLNTLGVGPKHPIG